MHAADIFGNQGLLVRHGRDYRAPQEEYASKVFDLISRPIADQSNVMIAMAEAGIGKTLGYGFPALHHVLSKHTHCVIAFSTQKLRDQAETEIRFARDLLVAQGYPNVGIVNTASYWDYFSLARVTDAYTQMLADPTACDADKSLITSIYHATVAAYLTGIGGEIGNRDLGFECDLDADSLCLRYDGEPHPFKINKHLGQLRDPDDANSEGCEPSIVLTTHAMLLRSFNMKRMAHGGIIGLVIVDECQDVLAMADAMIDVRVNLHKFLEDLKAVKAPRALSMKVNKVIKQLAPFRNAVFCRNDTNGDQFDICRVVLETIWQDTYDWCVSANVAQADKDKIDRHLVGLGDYLSLYLTKNRFLREFAEQTMHVEALMSVDGVPGDLVLRGVSTRPGALLSWLWYGKHRVSHVVLTTAFLRHNSEEPASAPVKKSRSVVRNFRSSVHLGDTPYVIESIQTVTNYGTATFWNIVADGPLPFIKVDGGVERNDYHVAAVVGVIKHLAKTHPRILVLCNSYADIQLYEQGLGGHTVFAQRPNSGSYKDAFVETDAPVKIMLSLEWAGLSIKGWSCVVIGRLPISPRDEAKERNHEALNTSKLMHHKNTIDRAIEKLYQGYGRGLRDATDNCLFVNMDPRMPVDGRGVMPMFLEAIPLRFREGFRAAYTPLAVKRWDHRGPDGGCDRFLGATDGKTAV